MRRRFVTRQIVDDVERLLADNVSPTLIAAELDLTEYVVRVIAADVPRATKPRSCRASRGVLEDPLSAVDVTTVRLIQRMLAANVGNHSEIARRAGVSKKTVTNVAGGRRLAVEVTEPQLGEGERFVPGLTRCERCGAQIFVVPCRACRMRILKNSSSTLHTSCSDEKVRRVKRSSEAAETPTCRN